MLKIDTESLPIQVPVIKDPISSNAILEISYQIQNECEDFKSILQSPTYSLKCPLEDTTLGADQWLMQ